MAKLLGEVLTIRALVYYDLIRAWGDVPARFEPITSGTIYRPKESRDVIFKHLMSVCYSTTTPPPGTDVQSSAVAVKVILSFNPMLMV